MILQPTSLVPETGQKKLQSDNVLILVRYTDAAILYEVLTPMSVTYGNCAAVKLNFHTLSTTRGTKYKLQKSASHYNLRKFSFLFTGG